MGEAIQARISGRTATASCQAGTGVPGPAITRQATAAATTPATTTAGHMPRQTARDELAMARSVWDAVRHSSKRRRDTAMRHRVRTIASAETQA